MVTYRARGFLQIDILKTPDDCEDIKHLLFTCSRAKEIWQRLGVWRKLERVLESDRSGSVLVADLIKISRTLEKLNSVGLAELILTGG